MQQSTAMNYLQKNIRVLLAAREMTQNDLAERCGIAPGNLSVIIHGKQRVTIQRAERIAAAFGISLSELLDENLEKIVAVPA